jgi:hypothetical protein
MGPCLRSVPPLPLCVPPRPCPTSVPRHTHTPTPSTPPFPLPLHPHILIPLPLHVDSSPPMRKPPAMEVRDRLYLLPPPLKCQPTIAPLPSVQGLPPISIPTRGTLLVSTHVCVSPSFSPEKQQGIHSTAVSLPMGHDHSPSLPTHSCFQEMAVTHRVACSFYGY